MHQPRIGIRLVSCFIMLLWGGVLLYFYASGRLSYYLPPDGSFRPMVLWGGIAMCVIALFNLCSLGTPEPGCGHDHAHHDHDEHGRCLHGQHQVAESAPAHTHSHGALESSGPLGRLVALVILVVPIGMAALLSPDQYSMVALENKGLYQPPPPAEWQESLRPPERESKLPTTGNPLQVQEPQSMGSFTFADLEAQIPRNKQGEFEMDIMELFYTAGDREVADVLDGRKVETIGRVIEEKVDNPGGTRLRIFRLSVMCCVADARPCSIAVEFGKPAPTLKPMTWVKVRGTMRYPWRGTHRIPVLEADSCEECAEPLSTGNVF